MTDQTPVSPTGRGSEARETPDHVNGWACVDCLMFLANGETPPELDEDETAAWLANLTDRGVTDDAVTLGRMYGEDGCTHDGTEDGEDHALECEQVTFSSSRCDVCGSPLGGSRDAVTFWVASARA